MENKGVRPRPNERHTDRLGLIAADYTAYPGLAGGHLEGSYVLSFEQSAERVGFHLDAVLTPDSPAYHHAPLPDEQNCFAHGTLTFIDVIDVDWLEQSTQLYRDAGGEQDLGASTR